MKVLDYVFQNDIQKFYCKTITKVILAHTHRSRAGKEIEVSELFLARKFVPTKRLE